MKNKRLKNGYGKHKRPITLTLNNGRPEALISLGNRKITKISMSDIDILKDYSFYAHERADGKYVARASQEGGPYLHRLLLNPGSKIEIDHVNADPLDNRRGNLREATTTQNNLAKKTELVYGYSGIVQTQVYSAEPYYDSRNRRCTRRKPNVFMAIGADGQHYGPFRSMEFPEEAAENAAKKRDELMLENYEVHLEDYVHHNFGFIHWNIEEPEESLEMDGYLEEEISKANELGIVKLKQLYPKELF